VTGTAWLDHEWSREYLDAEATGWDWIGLNFDDGSALMAFRIRDGDGGSTLGRRDAAAKPTARTSIVPQGRSPNSNPGRTLALGAHRHVEYPVEWSLRAGALTRPHRAADG
jgi:predicted secreted hydrolase